MKRIACCWLLVLVYFTPCAAAPEEVSPAPDTVVSATIQPPAQTTPDALPAPSLPSFIESITPQPNTVIPPRGQISLQFRHPLVALGRIDQPETEDILQYFTVTPKIVGKFRLANPNLVVFEPIKELPAASRLQVTVKQGLTDLQGNTLEQDLQWSFEVQPLSIEISTHSPSSLTPSINIYASASLKASALAEAMDVRAADGSPVPAFTLKFNDDRQPPAVTETAPPDPDGQSRNFQVVFREPLKKATQYSIMINGGLSSVTGNLPLANAVQSTFSTFYPLKASLGSEYSRVFKTEMPVIRFNNSLAEGATEFVEVDPKPKARLFVFEQGDTLSLDDRYLKAQTLYRVTLKQGLKDVFGQELENTVTLDLQTGSYRGGLWAPEDIIVVQPALAQQLTVHSVNVPPVHYSWRALGIKDLQALLVHDYIGRSQLSALLPAKTTWKKALPKAKNNKLASQDYALPELLKSDSGALVYGFASDFTSEEYFTDNERFGMLVRTDLGVYSQWLPEQGMVQVYRLSDGTPAPATTVNIYTMSGEAPCASGTTDQAGGVQWSGAELAQCVSELDGIEGRFKATPRLLIEVRQGTDWTFNFSHINTRQYYGNYSFDDGDYEEGRPYVERPPNYSSSDWSGAGYTRGVLFSDRFMYKPGETVTLTGMVRGMRGGKLSTPKDHNFTFYWVDPGGIRKELGKANTNDYGSFSLSVLIPSDAKLGFYQLLAEDDAPVSYSLNGSMRIAEFRAPPFKAQAAAAQDKITSQQQMELTVSGEYLHGAPLDSGRATVNITRRKFSPRFDGYDEFSFRKPYIYGELEKAPVFQEVVMQQAATLDAAGKAQLQVPIDALPFPARYSVDAEISDSANVSLTGKTSFEAYPRAELIGVNLSDYVIGAGERLAADVIVLNLDGKPVSGKTVHVKLRHIDWSSALHELSNGVELEQHPTLKTVATLTFQSGLEPVTIRAPTEQGGHYIFEANFDDNPATLSAEEVFVVGAEEASWYQADDDTVPLKLNKTAFKAGDTAKLLVQSPYPEAEALITVLRDQVYHRERRLISGASALFSFTITEAMVPNAQVQVMLTRRGDIKSAKHLVRLGAAAFSVNHKQLALNIALTPEHAVLEPAAKQTIQIQLSDAEQKPVQGQVSVIVANEAILQLNNHRPPKLLDVFYTPFPLMYATSDNRNYVQLLPKFKPFDKGWGYGGGFGSALANNLLRKNFQPMPFYRLDAVTDAEGRARLSFIMPDDLTTWRVMAIAADAEQRFGNADTTFRTSKKLIAEPALPRFARALDTFDAGVQIVNSSGQSGYVMISGALTPPLKFVTANGLASAVNWRVYISGQPMTQRFAIQASAPGVAELKFAVTGEGALAGLRDGFKLPFTAAQHQVFESTVQVGSSREDSAVVPLQLREGVNETLGGLTVQAASTLMTNVVEPLNYMINYPYGCIEQTSTRIIAHANMAWLSQHYGFPVDLPQLKVDIAGAYRHLLTMQTASGGFAFWPGEANPTHPELNAHVARAIAAYEQTGFSASPTVKKSLTDYLERELSTASSTVPDNKTFGIDMLLGLEALDIQRDDFLQPAFARRKQLSQITRLKLAQLLLTREQWQTEADQLMKELRNNMVFDGRTAQVASDTVQDPWVWLEDLEVQQAFALRTFALYPKADDTLVDRLLRGLLDARENGLWNNTYSNGQALDALVAFAKAREMETPNFTLEVNLAGRTLLNEVFDSFKQSEIFTPMAQLPSGKHDLQFNRQGTGTLHYLVSYRYSPLDFAPGRDSGIHVRRSLFELDNEQAIAEWDEALPTQALNLTAGKTYRVKLQVNLKQWSSHVAISDLLPAGLEAVDEKLATSSGRFASTSDWRFSYRETADQRVDAFIDEAEAGSYELEYFVRAVTPGKFIWPGGEAMLMYTPETFGRTAASAVEIGR